MVIYMVENIKYNNGVWISLLFDTFCSPSFSQCQKKINIKHLYGNISTEVLIILPNELLMKQITKAVLL